MVLPPGHLREFISRDSRLFRFPLFLLLLLHLPFSFFLQFAESRSLLRRPLVLFILHGIRRFPIRYQSFRENAGKRLRTGGLDLLVMSSVLSLRFTCSLCVSRTSRKQTEMSLFYGRIFHKAPSRTGGEKYLYYF